MAGFSQGLLTNPLFQIGGGLLQSAGNPLNPYGGIHSGLLNVQRNKQAQMMNDYTQQRMEEMKRQQAEAEAAREAARQQRGIYAAAVAQASADPQQKLMMLANEDFGRDFFAKQLETPEGRGSGIGKIDPGKYTTESVAEFEKTGDYRVLKPAPAQESSYYTPVPTAQGIAMVNNRDPSDVRFVNYVKSTDDPNLQGQIAEAKGAGTARGQAQGEAQAELSAAKMSADRITKQIDELLKHEGLDRSVGFWDSKTPDLTGPARDFAARYDQIRGGAFLQAREDLKGGGTITDFESDKAERAYARMDRSTTEESFKAALRDFKEAVQQGYAKLEARAGGNPVSVQTDAGGVPEGVDPADWGVMTPEERALWQ